MTPSARYSAARTSCSSWRPGWQLPAAISLWSRRRSAAAVILPLSGTRGWCRAHSLRCPCGYRPRRWQPLLVAFDVFVRRRERRHQDRQCQQFEVAVADNLFREEVQAREHAADFGVAAVSPLRVARRRARTRPLTPRANSQIHTWQDLAMTREAGGEREAAILRRCARSRRGSCAHTAMSHRARRAGRVLSHTDAQDVP